VSSGSSAFPLSRFFGTFLAGTRKVPAGGTCTSYTGNALIARILPHRFAEPPLGGGLFGRLITAPTGSLGTSPKSAPHQASLQEGAAERSESKIPMLAGGKHTATNRCPEGAEGVTPPVSFTTATALRLPSRRGPYSRSPAQRIGVKRLFLRHLPPHRPHRPCHAQVPHLVRAVILQLRVQILRIGLGEHH